LYKTHLTVLGWQKVDLCCNEAHWQYSAQNDYLQTQSSKEDYYAAYRTVRTVLRTPLRAKDTVKDHDKPKDETEIQNLQFTKK